MRDVLCGLTFVGYEKYLTRGSIIDVSSYFIVTYC